MLSTTKRDAGEVMREQARGVVRNLYAITPPNKGRVSKNVPTINGKQFGVAAIKRDLLGDNGKTRIGIFIPIANAAVLAHAKQHPDGKVQLWTRKDGTIYGTETTMFRPHASVGEMREHHRRYFKNGRMTRAGTGDRTIGRWKFVDKMVVSKTSFAALLKTLSDEVGDSCSGWNESAASLGVKPPQWIWKHRGSGGFSISITDSAIVIRMVNAVPWIDKIPKMKWEAKIQLALNLQTDAMERRLDNFIHKAAKKSGFKAAA